MSAAALALAFLAASPSLGGAACPPVSSNCGPVVGMCTIFPCDKTKGAKCVKQDVFGLPIGKGTCECPDGMCGLNGKCVPKDTPMCPGDAPGGALPSILAETSILEQCMLTKSKWWNQWEGRMVSVADGKLTWSYAEKCDLPMGLRGTFGEWARRKLHPGASIDLKSLPAPHFEAPDQSIPGGAGATHRCVSLGGDLWCAPEGGNMDKAMKVIDAQRLSLVALAGSAPNGGKLAAILASLASAGLLTGVALKVTGAWRHREEEEVQDAEGAAPTVPYAPLES